MNLQNNQLKWVDNHCHFEENDDIQTDLEQAEAEGVQKFIVVGTDLKTSQRANQLAQTFPNKIFATAGIHPHEAKHGTRA